jgi:hypothetical protein
MGESGEPEQQCRFQFQFHPVRIAVADAYVCAIQSVIQARQRDRDVDVRGWSRRLGSRPPLVQKEVSSGRRGRRPMPMSN